MNESPLTYLMLVGSAFLAGVVNAMAGGGTLLTFPALLAVLGSVQANATSTMALLPGSLASVAGYRSEIRTVRRLLRWLIWPSLVGGYIGAMLVTMFPQRVFDGLVPWLILLAAMLFLIQGPLKKLIRANHVTKPSRRTICLLVAAQFLIALYGGYFGAGIGILMLAVLPFMGTGSIHETNAAKTVLASAINLVTVIEFMTKGQIVWHYALIMAVTAIFGGYAGARIARRIPGKYVRWLVIALGFTLGAYYLWQQYSPPPISA